MKKWWIFLVIVCICFILFHSTIPESESAHESLWFTKQVIDPVLSRFGVKAEFCLLALVLGFWWKKPIKTFYAGFMMAFLDESLQVITGRGALITDIWIDLIGVGIGIGICFVTKFATNKTIKE